MGVLVTIRAALSLVPRSIWEALAAAAALFAIWHWHSVEVREGIRAGVSAGMEAQLAADGRAVARAFVVATVKQDATIAKVATAQAILSKGADDAIATVDAAADRALAAFRVQRASEAAAGRPGGDATASVQSAGVDHEAAASDAERVSVSPELIRDAAEDAGQAAECAAWVRGLEAVWPVAAPPVNR